MSRERIGLSYFETVIHRRFRKVTLMSEIKDCFSYFEHEIPDIGQSKKLGTNSIVCIHGNGIEIKKVEEGRGYSIEIGGVVRIVGVDTIPKSKQIEIVKKIRNITIPYSLYVQAKKK